MFREIFDDANRKCAEVNGMNNGDYVNEDDGLIYCGKCGTPKQTRLRNNFFDGIVSCMCSCAEAEYERAQTRKRRRQENTASLEMLRHECIGDTGLHGLTFGMDNGCSQKLMTTAKRYVSGWNEVREKNLGLYIFGNVGSGKTFAAACIANALIDKGYRAVMTDFPTIINALQGFDTADKNGYLNRICGGELLIIDDFGVERQTEFAMQVAEQVIDKRCKAQRPLIITSNIPYKVIENPPDLKYMRIYSRIREMTVPVVAAGEDKRAGNHRDKMNWAKEFFGR